MPFLCSKHCSNFTAKGKDFYICLQGHIGSELLPLPTTFSPPSLPPNTRTAYRPWKTPPHSYFRVFALAAPSVSAWLPFLFLSLFQNAPTLNIHLAHSFHSIGSSGRCYFSGRLPLSFIWLQLLPHPFSCFRFSRHLTYTVVYFFLLFISLPSL